MSATLGEVAAAVGAVVTPLAAGPSAVPSAQPATGSAGTAVSDVVHDSRKAVPGTLFACIAGDRFDGHDFAAEAVRAGAAALLCSRRLDLETAQIVVPDVRAALGPAAAEIHGHPSRSLTVIGVTGTNGKTTTVRMTACLAQQLGCKALEIGTLTGARTTPEAPELQRQLAAARNQGADLVAMEVSSHALDQKRVDATRFAAVGFTNLGVDHLDHHGDIEAYYRAKAGLFSDEFAAQCVIDARSDGGRRLLAETTLKSLRIDDDSVEILTIAADSAVFRWRGHRVRLGIGASFNVANAVLAAELLVCVGFDPSEIATAFAAVGPIPGRFEVIESDDGPTVVVDYAHTPDGLEAVLRAAREIASGELSVVFGAGGDRDRLKRPLMGEVAGRLADRAVVTSDNPRSESAEAIISEICAGMARPAAFTTVDRRQAIRHSIARAGPGDVVLIAGKGHEKTQETASGVIEFDDSAVARHELRRQGA